MPCTRVPRKSDLPCSICRWTKSGSPSSSRTRTQAVGALSAAIRTCLVTSHRAEQLGRIDQRRQRRMLGVERPGANCRGPPAARPCEHRQRRGQQLVVAAAFMRL